MNILALLLILVSIESRPEFNYRLGQGAKRKLEASSAIKIVGEWKPLRIHFEYLKSDYDSDSVTFLNKVFEIVGTFIHRYLLVRRSETSLTFKSSYPTNFYGFEISSTLQQKTYQADYVQQIINQVLFVNIENNSSESYVAYCGPAIIDTLTLRPIMGLMSWNMNYTDLKSLTDSSFEGYVEAAIHEITHGLGFIDEYFSKFYDSVNGSSYESPPTFTLNNIVYLSTPRIITQAQFHFNCASIDGIPMENEGGSGTAGSHFERSLFYNELMTGSTMTGNFIITDFTFQFFQDTGFYRIADYNPDNFLWGENQGCNFFEKSCKGGTYPEFCSIKGTAGCSYNRGGVSACYDDQLADSCLYQMTYSDYDCRDKMSLQSNPLTFQYFGYDSMCVTGSVSKDVKDLTKQSCYQYSCDSNNKLTLYIDGQTFDCSKSGPATIPNNYYGNLQCPTDASSFCKNVDECPNQCNQKGLCLGKQCICMSGYSGKGCTDTCKQYRFKEQCVTQCPDSTYVFEDIKYCVGCPGYCETCTSYNLCTKCKTGYQLRGGFCDNYDLLTLKQYSSASSTNVTTTNNTTPSNTTQTSENSTTDNSTSQNNSTETTSSTNSTNTTNTTDQNNSTNSTDQSNSTNSTEQTNSTNSSNPVVTTSATSFQKIYLFSYFILMSNS